MTRLAIAVYRASLRAYPPAFRHEYERLLVGSLLDQHRIGGAALWRVVVRELADVASSAPRMRGESPMTRFVLAIGGVTICVLAALAAGPFALLAGAAGAVAVWSLFNGRAPTSGDVARGRGGARWLAGGAAALAGAVAIPQIDGGELSELWWSVMALLVVIGVALIATGLHHRFIPPSARPTTSSV